MRDNVVRQVELARRVDAGLPVLTDGGIETRLMFEPDIVLDPDLQVAAMVEDPETEPALRAVYQSYLSAAGAHRLPAVIGTPTFRASANPAHRAGADGRVGPINAAAVAMHRQLAAANGSARVWVAGVLGPAGDAYQPQVALDRAEAATYHREQADALAEAGADLLFAATFPAVGEAIGVSDAMRATGLPAVVSFVLDGQGSVLDGTPLAEAVDRVDQAAAPAWFSLSCIHPSVAHRALARAGGHAPRVREVKANASRLTPDELVLQDHPVGDPPQEWAQAMWTLHQDFGVPVLGGCCGTDERHIDRLGALVAASA